MFAVGVGKAVEEELREIASEPVDEHFSYSADFNTMTHIVDNLKLNICPGTVFRGHIPVKPMGNLSVLYLALTIIQDPDYLALQNDVEICDGKELFVKFASHHNYMWASFITYITIDTHH